jgi:hypothetical protein
MLISATFSTLCFPRGALSTERREKRVPPEITQRRLRLERLSAALLIGALLFAVSYFTDWALFWLNIPGVSTLANNIVIGACAAVAAYIWVKYEAERQSRAREKMILVAELNHHIRNAVTLLGQSAALEDGPDKLRLMDEAVDRIDRVLTELVPTAGETLTPRLFLDERAPRPKPTYKQ